MREGGTPIRGFTDALRSELAHDRSRVRVSALHLPAVNTPQFEYVRTRLPGHPKPVPPIFQPEVIARAVLHVARRPTRELWIAWSTVRAILGQKLFPGLLDRYLGRIGYAAQQADRPPEPGRPDNLERPVPGDKGARGEFDAEAHARSPFTWLRLRRRSLATVAAALGLGIAGWRGVRALRA